MSQNPVRVELSEAEWRLVQALRELPESGLKAKVHGVMEELLFYVRNPRCQGMGAEGFPCGEPVTTCEACHEVWDLLDALGERVKA